MLPFLYHFKPFITMNKIVLVLSAFLITTITCTAQETTTPIHKKSNRIILHFDDTTGLFLQLGRILIDRGYDIDFKDRELGILRTKQRVWLAEYYTFGEIKTIFRDSTVTIYAETHSRDYTYVKRFNQRNDANQKTTNSVWEEMMKIGNILHPKYITYTRFE
jgi:hypothetical protein